MSVLEMSLQASAMIVLIVAVRALGMHRLPKWGFQALWGIVVARLLVPVRVEFHLSAYNAARGIERALIPAAPLTAAPESAPLIVATAFEPAPAAISTAPVFHISPWLALWLAGAILLLLYFILTHLHWRRGYAKARVMSAARVGAFRWSRCIAIKESVRVDAPLAYGVLRPVILMPKDLVNRPEFDCALAHELIHVRHWDALKKWVLTLALCAHWFNPLVWEMYVLACRDIELYCDDSLLRALGGGQKTRYASMLLDLEESRCTPAPLVSHFGRNAVEERIGAIMRYSKTSILGVVLALVLVVFTTVALATSAVTPTDGVGPAATNQAEESGAINLPEDVEMFAPYTRFGLTYDEEKDLLYYDGQLVRNFEDRAYPFDEMGYNRGMVTCTNLSGAIDVHAVWGPSRRYGSDETFDPWQGLMSIEAYTQQEFDARTDEIKKGIHVEELTPNVTTVPVSSAAPSASGILASASPDAGDNWTVAPNNYTADEVPVRALNAEHASDALYQYRVTPLHLDLAELAEAYFGMDAGKLPSAPSGDEDVVLASSDRAYTLYRDAQMGTIQLRRPGSIPLGYQNSGASITEGFGEPAVELPTPSPEEGKYTAQEAAGMVLRFLKDACGVDTQWLTYGVLSEESAAKEKSKAYELFFTYMLDGRRLLGDSDTAGDCSITAYVTDEGIMNLSGSLFRIEKIGPVPSGELPMTEEQVLAVATQGSHPPYGQAEICYYLSNLSKDGSATRTVWSLPLLDLGKGECFGREFRDGRTGEDLRGF